MVEWCCKISTRCKVLLIKQFWWRPSFARRRRLIMDNNEALRKKPSLCLNIIKLIYYQTNNLSASESFTSIFGRWKDVLDVLLMRSLKWGWSRLERQLAKYIHFSCKTNSTRLFHLSKMKKKEVQIHNLYEKGWKDFSCCRRPIRHDFWIWKEVRKYMPHNGSRFKFPARLGLLCPGGEGERRNKVTGWL